MANFLDWKYFSESQVDQLENANNESELKQVLSDVLLIDDLYAPEEAAIVKDFYSLCYCFCKDNAFSSRKIAAFLSIMHEAFNMDSSNINPSWRSDRSYERLQDVIFQHSIQRPPKSIQIFDKEDVEKILDFVYNRYYSVYNLYKCLFSKKIIKVMNQVEAHEVEAMRMPQSLSKAFMIIES